MPIKVTVTSALLLVAPLGSTALSAIADLSTSEAKRLRPIRSSLAMVWREFVGLLLLLLCSSSLGLSLTPNTQFKVYSSKDGLSIGHVESIYQDHEGFMWFGGVDGAVRYDSHEFEKFSHSSGQKDTLSNNIVRGITEDHSHRLWLATDNGLNLFDRDSEKFTSYFSDNHLQNIIWSVEVDKHNVLWLATVGGLVKFDTDQREFEFFDDPLALTANTSEYAVASLLIEEDGIIWVGSNGRGLRRVDTKTAEVTEFVHDKDNPNSVSSNTVWDLIKSADGTLWLGTSNGLDHFDPQTRVFTHYKNDIDDPTSLSQNEVTGLVADGDNIWVGTGNGISVLDTKTRKFVQIYHSPQNSRSLAGDVVRSLYLDQKSDVWIGTFPQGVSVFNRNDMAFQTHRHDPRNPKTISKNSVLSILEDSQKRLWIGTDGGGLNLFDPRSSVPRVFVANPKKPMSPQHLNHNAVLEIIEDHDGTFWMGTWSGGLSHYDPVSDTFTHYTSQLGNAEVNGQVQSNTSLRNNNIWTLLLDSKNNLWVGTTGGSLYKFNREEKNFLPYLYDKNIPSSLSSVFVWAILEDSNGTIWVGTNAGLDRLDQSTHTFTHFTHHKDDPQSLSEGTILSLYEDKNNLFWVGTKGGGLNLFDRQTGKAKRFGSKQGLQNLEVVSIKEDKQGYLWLGTRGGLSRFDPATEAFRHYDINNGLQGNQFNTNSAAKLSDGSILFGGTNGYTRVNPDEILDSQDTPKIALRELKILNKTMKVGMPSSPLKKALNDSEELVFNYKQSMITFTFAALNYRNSEKNQYSYRLEGFDKGWNYIGTQRSATYTNLDAGTYRFMVQALTYTGKWSETPRSIMIRVLPPPWQTWWAYALYTFITLGVIAGAILYQRNKRIFYQNQNKILEQRVAERTEELVQKEKLAALGSLVAGVSHELNTPLGNGLMVATSTLDTAIKFREEMDSGITRSMLANFVNEMVEGGQLIKNSLNKAADLVSNFKQIAVDRTSAQRRIFTMSSLLNEMEFTMRNLLKHSPYELVVDLKTDVELDSYPGPLGQVITNLIHNSILHGFDRRETGTIILSADCNDTDAWIAVEDNGNGIDPYSIKNIFDPFYTTKLGEGGSGLGLHIVHNIVVASLGGSIEVHSEVGVGTKFTVHMPLIAPNPDFEYL